MVCEPVYRGKPVNKWKFRGILTVDTNRKEYFKETREGNNLLMEILHPYAIFIAFLYEVETLQNRLIAIQETN